jgi:hypothetical protein
MIVCLQTLGTLVLTIERIHAALVLELGVHALVGAGGSRELVEKRSHAASLVSSLPLSLVSAALSAATILRMRSTSQHLGLGDRRDLAGRLCLNHGGVIQHLADGIEGGHSTSLGLASLLLKQLTIQRIGRAGSASSLASLALSVLLALSVSATLLSVLATSVLAALLISTTYGHF